MPQDKITTFWIMQLPKQPHTQPRLEKKLYFQSLHLIWNYIVIHIYEGIFVLCEKGVGIPLNIVQLGITLR